MGRCGCPQQGVGLADLHDTFDQGNAGSLSGDRNFHAILCNALFCGRCQEDDKLTQSLLKLAEEDRTLRVENDSENRQTLVYGISEQHLQAVADRLRAKYNVEMQLEAPKVAYRETIRGSADVEYKHKKQSGGHGQYGHVKKVSPSGDLTQHI